MKKIVRMALYSASVLAVLSSCSEDDFVQMPSPKAEIENALGTNELMQGKSTWFKAINKSSESDLKYTWTVNGKEVATADSFLFSMPEAGKYIVGLKSEKDQRESVTYTEMHVYGKFRDGTFILNEGNMSNETGLLIFVDREGVATDSAYYRANGSFLGNVAQDLFIHNGKMYIISQNGPMNGGEGILTVANAETLKKEGIYLNGYAAAKQLNWPSHIAVLSERELYIRDNNGLSLYDPAADKLTKISDTKGASKNRMVVADKKVFAPAGKNILVLKDGKVIEKLEMSGTVSGIIKNKAGNLYVSCTSNPAQILEIKPSDYSIVKSNELPASFRIGAGWGASPGITAKGDTIYFNNGSTTINRHIFGANETLEMFTVGDYVTNGKMAYNNMGVDPVSGDIYTPTIKGYGMDYLINNIPVFNYDDKGKIVLVHDYENMNRFPSGVYFTENFK